jgi:hypothetical protein
VCGAQKCTGTAFVKKFGWIQGRFEKAMMNGEEGKWDEEYRNHWVPDSKFNAINDAKDP